MPVYKVNGSAVRNAEKLIGDGKVDNSTEWSEGQPSTDDENEFVDDNGYEAFGEWHLAIDPEVSEHTKGRHAFPFGDFSKVYRDALNSAKQRAAQYGHDEIERAADRLLVKLGE